MAIILITETTDPIENYDATWVLLEARGLGHPAGRLSHVAARKGEGYMVVDIWESQEQLDAFAQTLVPLIMEAGGSTPELQVSEVHNRVVPA